MSGPVDAVGLLVGETESDEQINRIEEIADEADIDFRVDGLDDLRRWGPSVLVAFGETAVLELARADDIEVPVLPVLPAVGRGDVPYPPGGRGWPAAVEDVLAGRSVAVEHPVLGVSLGDRPVGRAVMDVSMISAEPARIAEFAVRDGGWRETVRADGVVVATPLGSAGYALDAGGPVLRPGRGVAAVVPIAPFRIRRTTWVVDPAAFGIDVLRDGGGIELRVDDLAVELVESTGAVRFEVATTIPLLVPEGGSGIGGPRGELEKL